MKRYQISNRKKFVFVFFVTMLCMLALMLRLGYLMVMQSSFYQQKAKTLHERQRVIKAARGDILDRNGKVLATNSPVYTVSVIHSQIKDEEVVIQTLTDLLEMDEEEVRKKVTKVSSIEKIKGKVPKETGDILREKNLSGVKIDADYKRFYPYGELASKVIGFTGADNQGIIGLEVKYDTDLSGTDGCLLTPTDVRGREIGQMETRIESEEGYHLLTSLDVNIQSYATMLAKQVLKAKEAEGVSIICMNPQNGEILALADVPEFDLNRPYTLTEEYLSLHSNDLYENKADERNRMWRNNCIHDTYEPGSTFKVITAAAALEEGVVALDDTFHCPGFCVVEDRRIRCHKTTGHGTQDFVTATMNSCNPVFVNVGLRLGSDRYYEYLQQFGILDKTGIDLPGEAKTIMHKKENIGLVELATMSFGQSFQVTPMQLITSISSLINGGKRITPHFGVKLVDKKGQTVKNYQYPVSKQILTQETSKKLRMILENVVEYGGGKNGQVEGYLIGGKTATSQTLPRGSGRYISSFVGFVPAQSPKLITLVLIRVPQGLYYGGIIAAPVERKLYENILPYLEIEKKEKTND